LTSRRGVPRRNSTFLGELGPGGLSSLALAIASGALTLGLPVAWQARRVVAAAAGAPPSPADAILVLGRELAGDEVTPVFAARLDHARALLAAGWAPRLIVSGGWTGTARRSEAAAGRDHLLACGVPADRIWIEERSRFTLENLFYVRAALRERGLGRLLLVSDPLHLARAATMARGLGLDVSCSPAAAAPPPRGSPDWWLSAAREGFLLHWYRVGILYSRAIGSARLLSRVR
jgi:uncharacterized SAM-binding protein YcdF (DUF218 family)